MITLLRFSLKSKLPIFQGVLPLKRPLVATFSETHALTSRKHAAEQSIKLKR